VGSRRSRGGPIAALLLAALLLSGTVSAAGASPLAVPTDDSGLVVEDDGTGQVEAGFALGAGGEVHSLPAPVRIVDTRTGLNTPAGAKPLTPGAGSTFDVPLLGVGGLPASSTDALAVLATVTVDNPSQPGFLKAWGAGRAEPNSSVLNFAARSTVPNLTLLTPGVDGRLSVKLASTAGSGSANVLIDVVGWISSSSFASGGDRLIPAGPGRIYDSRDPLFGGNPFGPGQAVQIPIRGASAFNPDLPGIVPNDPAVSSVIVNITGVNNLGSSSTTFVSAVPTQPSGAPSTSNLNLVRGQIKANLAMVPIGPDGAIWLYNSSGNAHLIVDVVGYLRPGSEGTRQGRIVPLDVPFRVIDTRENKPGAPAGTLGPGMAEDWNFASTVGDVRIGGVPVGPQLGFLGNLTGAELRRPSNWFGPLESYVTVYPAPASESAPPPGVSNLNLRDGQVVPNMALFRYGTGTKANQIRFFNYNGQLHYLVDAAAVILAD